MGVNGSTAERGFVAVTGKVNSGVEFSGADSRLAMSSAVGGLELPTCLRPAGFADDFTAGLRASLDQTAINMTVNSMSNITRAGI